jgi:para-nitrobenzyl esterase
MRRGTAVIATLCCAVLAAACGSASSTSLTTTSTAGANPAHYVVGGDPATIRTPDGMVHGTVTSATRQFLGIPFAQPPVGPLRWKAPHPVAPWATTLQATRITAECPQIVPIANSYTGTEDCLHLNVYAPKAVPTAPRPVMVWIYGGGFTVGSAADDNVSNFAANNNTVAVSFNYRLGPLGFLALPALAQEDVHHSTGDLGLLDQQAALRWVQANIASFGGDPHNVTIFGESAGGISVCAQLVSPGSAGLFEKAITESGPCNLPPQPLATAEAQGAQLGATLGCPRGPALLACLRAKPPQQVIDAMPPDPSFLFGAGAAWSPVADGVTLPTDPTSDLVAGHFHHVPLIVGANRNEGTLFVALHDIVEKNTLTDAQWAAAVDQYFGPTVGPQVQQEYPLSDYPDAGAALGQAVGDAVLGCPAVVSANILQKYVPVYEYEFDQVPNSFILPTTGIALGAFHSSELPFVFDGPTASSGSFTFTPAQQQLATAISGAWARFAATGSPAGGGLAWPRLTTSSGTYVSLTTPPSVKTAMMQSHCAFWARTGWSVANRASK